MQKRERGIIGARAYCPPPLTKVRGRGKETTRFKRKITIRQKNNICSHKDPTKTKKELRGVHLNGE